MEFLTRGATWIAGASILFALTACDSPEAPASSASGPGASGEDGRILFSEPFADSGLFQIAENGTGGLVFAVQARMGTKAEHLSIASAGKATLADVYRALHEGAPEVPEAVALASARMGDPRPVATDASVARPQEPALAKSASQAGFQSAFCKDIQESPFIWRWQTCDWVADANSLTTPFVDSDNRGTDRVYAMNNTNTTATMSLWNLDQTSSPNTWKPALAPFWMTWFQWGGTYSFAIAKIGLPFGRHGELGLSTHTPVPIVK